jgi:hypothetical protein
VVVAVAVVVATAVVVAVTVTGAWVVVLALQPNIPNRLMIRSTIITIPIQDVFLDVIFPS